MNHPRVMFQTPAREEDNDPPQNRLGKLTLKYNRKDLQRRLDIEEWIDSQLHLLFDCENNTFVINSRAQSLALDGTGKEDDIPELEIDIDELLELSDCERRLKLQDLLRNCGKPKEDFINELLYRIQGLRKMSGTLKK